MARWLSTLLRTPCFMFLAAINVSFWHYAVFVGAVVIFLAADLGVFHRRNHVVGLREASGWTALWVTLAFCFAFLVAPRVIPGWEPGDSGIFITGYLVELSLSMDNVFVIALIFAYFRVPTELQHRVLFWGILGALIMRGVLILVGVVLIQRFHWILYILGVFLVYSGVRMLFAGGDGVDLAQNRMVRLARRFFPVSSEFEGSRFLTKINGRRALTPLALVLLVVETTDLVFALDSIPAIFGITSDGFLVFTSNVFAILGLRSLYFVLASAIRYFHYLKYGLSLVLVFIGLKMLVKPWYEMPVNVALSIVGALLVISMGASIIAGRKTPAPPSNPDPA